MGRTVPVMMGFDRGYMFPSGVAIHSVLEHADPSDRYRFYILTEEENVGMDDGFFELLAAKFSNFTWEYRTIPAEVFANIQLSVRYSSAATYYRLLAARLLPELEYGIYLDGDIAVESRKGEGSTFTVTVRLKAVETPEAAESPSTQEVSLAGRHILIVEDVDLNADLLADLLELEDISSERAENGRVAVDTFAQSPPGRFDAILMDLRMPVMDGLEAARAIRALPRSDAGTVPIIALTANAFEEDVRKSLEAGMNAHLPKPVDTDRLFETLRQLLA